MPLVRASIPCRIAALRHRHLRIMVINLVRNDCAMTTVVVPTKTSGSATEYTKGTEHTLEQEREDADTDEGQPRGSEKIREQHAHDLFPRPFPLALDTLKKPLDRAKELRGVGPKKNLHRTHPCFTGACGELIPRFDELLCGQSRQIIICRRLDNLICCQRLRFSLIRIVFRRRVRSRFVGRI